MTDASSFLLLPSSFPALAAAFVTPALALVGVLLAAIPIVIHLLNRRRFKTVEWAAMRFVLEAMRRNRRRLRFESWMLLALRCLLVGLIGVALARPLGCAGSALAGVVGGDRALHLLVIDNSGSTALQSGESTVLDDIKAAASSVLQLAAGGEARAAAFSAAAPAGDVVPEPAYDLAAVDNAVAALPQSSGATDLAGALDRAIELAATASAQDERVVLHVFTDAAAVALDDPRLEAIGGRLAELDVEVRLYAPDGDAPANAAVVDLRPAQALVRRGFDAQLVATLAAFGGEVATDARWSVAGRTLDQLRVELSTEPRELAASPAVVDAFADGRPRVLSVKLADADALPADDERLRVIEQVADLPVLVVEGRSAATAAALGNRSLLATALAPGSAGYLAVDRISDLELATRPLDDYRAVVLSNVGGVDAAIADRLANFVRGGGTLMTWLGGGVSPDAYNEALLPAGLLPGRLARVVNPPAGDEGPSLHAFAFDPGEPHPYLDAFRGVDRSGLAAPTIRRYWQLEPADNADATVVLAFAGTGDPAVVAGRLGAGTIVTIATSADDPEWTLLPLIDNYAALVHELFRGAVGDAGGGAGWQNLIVGDRLVVPPSAGLPAGETPRLLGDAGTTRLDRRADEGLAAAWTSPPLTEPGAYELSAGEVRLPIVVNVPRTESDVRRADEPALRAALGDVELTLVPLSATTGDELAEARDRPDWGWPVLVLAGLIGLTEVGYAAFLGRRRA